MNLELIQKSGTPHKHGNKLAMLVLVLAVFLCLAFLKAGGSGKTYTFFSAQGAGSSLAASEPVAISIPSLDINAAVAPLGLNKDGSIQVPSKDNQVGWYKYGAAPGQPGAAVLVGHLDSAYGKAVFYNLGKLKIGQEIQVAIAGGSVAVFKVDSLEQAPQNNFPTAKVYGKIAYPGIRLITCSGVYNKKEKHYSNNLIVYGSLVEIRAPKY